MGFLDGLADFIDYMMFGENSKSAARMREEREKYEREAQARFEKEQAAKAAGKKSKVRNWDKEPTLGSVNGEHEVYFKTSRDGHTLIAGAKHGPDKFDRQYGDPNSGKHDHFGSGRVRAVTVLAEASILGLASSYPKDLDTSINCPTLL